MSERPSAPQTIYMLYAAEWPTTGVPAVLRTATDAASDAARPDLRILLSF